MKFVILLVLVCFLDVCCGSSVVTVIPGMSSVKSESNGLMLPATSTYKPIRSLTTTVHVTSEQAIFVHYQITLGTANSDFYSKLVINNYDVAAVVHTGNQNFKTAVGFYMSTLYPGYHIFKVYYKSSATIRMKANWDWQTAILQVIWADDAKVVSEGIKCPASYNAYNNWGPLKDLSTVIHTPDERVVLSAYQFSADMKYTNYMLGALNVDGMFEQSSTIIRTRKCKSLPIFAWSSCQILAPWRSLSLCAVPNT